MSRTRLFRFNLILLVAGLIIAPWSPVVALAPNPNHATGSVSSLAPQTDPIYVDTDAPGPLHDGLTWTTAYTDLQDALITATSGSEIWVAEGIYIPGAAGNRLATFHPQGDVVLYGGFAGNETALSERDWVAYPTVLSGDLDHDDLTTPSGIVTDTGNIIGDNAYHVLTLDYTITIDGFIITAGQATGAYPDENGGGVFNTGTTTLSNVVLSGNQSYYSGGGIYGYGNLTLISVIASNNQAGNVTQTGYGGGMYTLYGTPTLTNVIFSGNRTSGYGGGMYNLSGNMMLLNVTFNDNEARFGGGLYNDSSNSTLTDVTFSDNYTTERGGGMIDYEGGSTLTNVVFSHNRTDGTGGGTCFENYNSSTLISVTFTGNQAGYGGGGICNNSSSPTLLTVTLINSQSSLGAGMFNESGSPVLTDVTFENNVADQSGGGMYNTGTNPSSTLTHVTFSNNQAGDGGGMYNIQSHTGILTDVTFSHNQALNYGGGMYNGSNSAPTLITVTFSENQASDGGGMYNDQANPILANVTFTNNLSYFGNGGGGMFNFVSTPTLHNVTFTGNSAIGNSMSGGGGMYNVSSDPILTNVIFDDNQADAYGGGLQNSSSDPTLTNVTFSHNQASSGGGMYNRDASAPTLMTVTFTSNLASNGGGMLNTVGSHPTLIDVNFISNQATTSGGGMENDWDSNPILTNVTFNGNSANDGGGMRNFQSSPYLNNVVLSGNQATGYGGGIANEEGSHPLLINATFGGNRAGYGNGGGIYNNDSNPTLVNCILWGNDAYADPEISNVGTSLPNLAYSDVFWASGVYTGTGNLNLDPQFVSPITATVAPTTTGDYHLLPTSPVIDAGNNFSVTVSVDRDGNPRRMNVPGIPDTGLGTLPFVDLGAYEVEGVAVTLTLNTLGNGAITSEPSGSTFDYGTVVTLTATPGADSIFAGWSGDLSSTTNPITLTMDADKSVTGTFTLNTYTLTLNTIGNGAITSEPSGPTFAYGTVVTLNALPNAGSTFTGWSGDLSGMTNPITLTMDADKNITGTFALNTYTLTLNTIGNGAITSEPSGSTFAYGTVVTLTALPGTGSAFTGWSGALSGTTNPITLTMDATKIVTATFQWRSYLPLTIK